MSDGDALLAAILAHPDEDVPRLAYADWLDEHGGAAARDRAEFVRAQVELARVPPEVAARWPQRVLELKAREKVLLTLNGMRWLDPLSARGGPLDGTDFHAQFRRGFVEVVWMPASRFAARAPALFALAPVRELRVTHTSLNDLSDLVWGEHFPRLNALDLSDRRLGDDVARVLTFRSTSAGLRTLRLSACGLTDGAAHDLAQAPFHWPLHELDVRHNTFTAYGVTALRDRFGADAVRVSG